MIIYIYINIYNIILYACMYVIYIYIGFQREISNNLAKTILGFHLTPW